MSRRDSAMTPVRSDEGYVTAHAPRPRRFKLSYLITAWTQRPEDEHRLLAACLAALIRSRRPARRPTMQGALAEQPLPALVTVAQPLGPDRSIADIWSALGGEMKPSLDVIVTAPFVVAREVAAGAPILELPRITVGRPDTDDVERVAALRRARATTSRRPTGGRTGTAPPGGADRPGRDGRRRHAGEAGPRHPGSRPLPTVGRRWSSRPPTDASARHLAGRLGLVADHVRVAVERRRAGDPDPDDRFRGLYVSDAQVDHLLAGGHAPLVVAADADGAAADAPWPRSSARPTPRRRTAPSCGSAASPGAFELEALDVELLLVALAPDLDPRFERLYGYLHDDVSRRRASVGLALELSGAGEGSGAGRARLGPLAPLVAGGLLVVEDAGPAVPHPVGPRAGPGGGPPARRRVAGPGRRGPGARSPSPTTRPGRTRSREGSGPAPGWPTSASESGLRP